MVRRPPRRHPLHFAKTGTDVNADASATVDTWITGGLQFANGAGYSYVVMIGTGSTAEPWGRNLHASQVAVPLLETLLGDLAGHARSNPVPGALPPKPAPSAEAPVRKQVAQPRMTLGEVQAVVGN